MSFWCFVFVRCLIYKVQCLPPLSLFPNYSVSAELHYITKALACQALFSTFSKFLSSQPQAFIQAPALANFAILPQPDPFVKSFFASRQTFSLNSSPVPPVARALIYISKSFPPCQPFFDFFSHFFSSPKKPQDMRSFSWPSHNFSGSHRHDCS